MRSLPAMLPRRPEGITQACHQDTKKMEQSVHKFIPVSQESDRILLERVYEVCLCHELSKRGIATVRQLTIPIKYEDHVFDEGLRLDILVADEVIVEIKAVDQVNPVWDAQVLSHLKLTGKRLGYLINFNVPLIKNGIKRFVV